MKTIMKLWLVLFVFSTFKVAQAESPYSDKADVDNKIAYNITIHPNNHRLANVSLTFTPKDSILYMTQGANDLPKRWATFVHNLKAVDSNGDTISVTPLPDAMWKLPSSIQDQITVSYQLRLDHEDHEWSGGLDGVAYATDWGVFYTGRALLLFHANNWDEITVDFNVPSNWVVTTPWKAIANSENSFIVDSQSALMQSMIFAGTHEELTFKRDDFELVFALGGEKVIAEKEAYQKLAAGVLDYYIDLMGGLPNPPPDNALTKSVVIVNSSHVTDGEVIGNNISILIEKDGDATARMISWFIFAHEFFHLWNAKSFSPDGQDTEWFKEGFTNYYTLKGLYHVGFLDDTSFFETLNNLFFQRYNNDEGLGTLSMTQGAEKHAHWGIIYGGGLFVGIAQDMIIRKATNNTKSIDDLMKGLFKQYGGTHDHYTLDDLLDGLSELSGKDQTEFFESYVIGVQRIPIATYLSLAGLDAKIKEGKLQIKKKASITSLQENMIKGLLGLGPSN